MTAVYLQLIARVTSDPVIRTTSTGKSYYSFTVVSDLKKNEPLWVTATLWPGKSDSAIPYIKKKAVLFLVGTPQFKLAYVESEPKLRTYLSVDCLRIVKFAENVAKEENPSENTSSEFNYNTEAPMTTATTASEESKEHDEYWEMPF